MTLHHARRVGALAIACALAGCSGAAQSFVPGGSAQPSSVQTQPTMPGGSATTSVDQSTTTGAASQSSPPIAPNAGPNRLCANPLLAPSSAAIGPKSQLTVIVSTCTTPAPISPPANPNPPDPNPCNPTCGGKGGGVAYNGKPQDFQHCDGSQFDIGANIAPADENAAGAGYYVNDISNVWQNGAIVAVIYQATTQPGGGTDFYFIQETNNGASTNWGASVGVSFGPVNIGVSGGQGYSDVSPIEWFFPGQSRLPAGSSALNCWPSDPMPS